MKLKKRIFTILALIAVAVGVGSVCNTPNTAQAKGIPTVFPKNMRGTWYQYYNDGAGRKYLSKVKITKTTYILGEYTPKVIHKYIPHDKPDFERADWIFIPGYQKQRDITWLNVKQWNEPAGIGIPDTGDDGEDGGWGENGGEFFNVSKLKGHQVLSIANTINGTSIHNTSHWYRSVKLAKKLNKRHYKGFLY